MPKFSTLSLIAMLFFVFGLAGIIFALIRKITGIRAARKGEAVNFRQGTQIFLPFCVGLVFILISQGLFWLSSQRSNFRQLSFTSPAAEFMVKQTKEETYYVDFREGETAAPVKIPYLKPYVKVITQVVVWKPFFSFLGPLHTARITRIEFTDEAGGTYVFTNSDQAGDFADWIVGVNKYFPIAIVRILETRPQPLAPSQRYKLFVSMEEAELKSI